MAAFRTYTWDDCVAELADRFFRACRAGRHVVLADETRGALRIRDHAVISHTTETSSQGLPVYPPDNPLWFNADYGIYVLRAALPDYDYYVLSESDLAVNLDLEPMLAAAQARDVDVVAHGVKPSTPDWTWHDNGRAAFAQPWKALLFFMVLSGRAIDRLAAERRRLAAEFKAGRLAEWTFCEPFFATVLKEAGMRFAEVSEFADTKHLNFRPRIEQNDPRANRPGSLVHSVMGGAAFIKTVVHENPPRDWLRPASALRRALEALPLTDYAPVLKAAFERGHDHAGLVEFLKVMNERGLTWEEPDDLAYCKPALSSSTSEWSRSRSPEKDACGANGAVFHDDLGFHTAQEQSPWWTVDLCAQFVIDAVAITNRRSQPERFVTFSIQSSLDHVTWVTRYAKTDLAAVSADPDAPLRVPFSDPFVARHVRIVLIGFGALHLRRVRVFGRKIVPESA